MPPARAPRTGSNLHAIRATSSSSRVRMSVDSQGSKMKSSTQNRRTVLKQKAVNLQKYKSLQQDLTPDQAQRLHNIHTQLFDPDDDDPTWETQTEITESQIGMDRGRLEAVLAGHEALDISHAGGELKDIWNQLYNGITRLEIAPEQNLLHHDTRTRRSRTQNQSDAFDAVMEPLTSAYMTWDLERPEEG
ncbi:hypothetical protein ARMGADRAFT_1077957 [Armillaria gallica]|uniref:Uncharacterized protein n=1 Tax=Armillaria gallica TaxID=47427 RepID=A0A2H3DIY9_ARMGA|nr:hypothetical protein ARMGADRAFT_1077957 [Armillaria gallica]